MTQGRDCHEDSEVDFSHDRGDLFLGCFCFVGVTLLQVALVVLTG
jgi:hypothetical protein